MTEKNYYHIYLPRYVPVGDIPRLVWGRQLVTEYKAVYQGAYPVLDDPEALNELISSLLQGLDQADELLVVLGNASDLYHGNIDLKNHFLYGKDGEADITVTRATQPVESGASKLKPGLMQRLLWLAYRLHELGAPENILKALGIFDPGPQHTHPADVELHPSDISDGQIARFYIPLLDPVKMVRVDCDYHDGKGLTFVGISDAAHFDDDEHPFTTIPQQRDYTFRALGKGRKPIGKLSELSMTAVIGSVRGKLK